MLETRSTHRQAHEPQERETQTETQHLYPRFPPHSSSSPPCFVSLVLSSPLLLCSPLLSSALLVCPLSLSLSVRGCFFRVLLLPLPPLLLLLLLGLLLSAAAAAAAASSSSASSLGLVGADAQMSAFPRRRGRGCTLSLAPPSRPSSSVCLRSLGATPRQKQQHSTALQWPVERT